MALLDKEENYIRIVPSKESQEMVDAYTYKGVEHRTKEKNSIAYISYLQWNAQKLTDSLYNEMKEYFIALGFTIDGSISSSEEQEYLEQYPNLKNKKTAYDLAFYEYCMITNYLQGGEPPSEPLQMLESYLGCEIPADVFIDAPQILSIAIGKITETAQQAYEEVKALKIFGETRDI